MFIDDILTKEFPNPGNLLGDVISTTPGDAMRNKMALINIQSILFDVPSLCRRCGFYGNYKKLMQKLIDIWSEEIENDVILGIFQFRKVEKVTGTVAR